MEGKAHSEKTKEEIRQKRLLQVVPTKDTVPEKHWQKLLDENGIKYTKHKAILGQPDIFIKPNICIYADGDYWHANPKFYKPNSIIIGKKKAKDIWKKDKEITAKNKKQGYVVLRYWECDIINSPKMFLREIIKIIKEAG